MTYRLFAFLTLLLWNTPSQATVWPDRNTIKQARQVHRQTQYTVLCHLPIGDQNRIHLSNNELLPQAATRVRWGYIASGERLGLLFGCWHSSCLLNGKLHTGHRCCQQQNTRYAGFATDLHNVMPLLPKAAGLLQQYRIALVPIADEVWPTCGLKLSHSSHLLEPPDTAKGVIARAYLYLHEHYGYPLSIDEITLFLAWHTEYPATDWERAWDNAVYKLQGTHNPFISEGTQ
ncbi:MAG: endonuclease [Pseudomonadota bacterium]